MLGDFYGEYYATINGVDYKSTQASWSELDRWGQPFICNYNSNYSSGNTPVWYSADMEATGQNWPFDNGWGQLQHGHTYYFYGKLTDGAYSWAKALYLVGLTSRDSLPSSSPTLGWVTADCFPNNCTLTLDPTDGAFEGQAVGAKKYLEKPYYYTYHIGDTGTTDSKLPKRENYNIKNWINNARGISFNSEFAYTQTGDLTLKAIWEPKPVKITLVYGHGIANEEIETNTITKVNLTEKSSKSYTEAQNFTITFKAKEAFIDNEIQEVKGVVFKKPTYTLLTTKPGDWNTKKTIKYYKKQYVSLGTKPDDWYDSSTTPTPTAEQVAIKAKYYKLSGSTYVPVVAVGPNDDKWVAYKYYELSDSIYVLVGLTDNWASNKYYKVEDISKTCTYSNIYTISSWNTKQDGSGTTIKSGQIFTTDTTLYAQYSNTNKEYPHTFKVPIIDSYSQDIENEFANIRYNNIYEEDYSIVGTGEQYLQNKSFNCDNLWHITLTDTIKVDSTRKITSDFIKTCIEKSGLTSITVYANFNSAEIKLKTVAKPKWVKNINCNYNVGNIYFYTPKTLGYNDVATSGDLTWVNINKATALFNINVALNTLILKSFTKQDGSSIDIAKFEGYTWGWSEASTDVKSKLIAIKDNQTYNLNEVLKKESITDLIGTITFKQTYINNSKTIEVDVPEIYGIEGIEYKGIIKSNKNSEEASALTKPAKVDFEVEVEGTNKLKQTVADKYYAVFKYIPHQVEQKEKSTKTDLKKAVTGIYDRVFYLYSKRDINNNYLISTNPIPVAIDDKVFYLNTDDNNLHCRTRSSGGIKDESLCPVFTANTSVIMMHSMIDNLRAAAYYFQQNANDYQAAPIGDLANSYTTKGGKITNTAFNKLSKDLCTLIEYTTAKV